MAQPGRIKVWVNGEILTAPDQNAEFDNIIDNQEDLGFPRTMPADYDGQAIILSPDGNTQVISDINYRVDFEGDTKPLMSFIFASGDDDGFSFTSAPTADPSTIVMAAMGDSTNINIDIMPKGTGVVNIAGVDFPVPTTRGDVIAANSALDWQLYNGAVGGVAITDTNGDFKWLPVGTDGQILTADSTGDMVVWEDPGGSFARDLALGITTLGFS